MENIENGNSEVVARGESGDKGKPQTKSQWWSPERERVVMERFEILNRSEILHGFAAHMFEKVAQVRYRLFCFSVWKVFRDIIELGGEYGVTNSQLWEVYEHPDLHPYWRAKGALDYGVKLKVFTETREVRLNKGGRDQKQVVYRVGESIDEIMGVLARELDEEITHFIKQGRELTLRAMRELVDTGKVEGLADA